MEADGNIISALIWDKNTERYRSGHNEAVLKTVWGQPHKGSNPFLSAIYIYTFKDTTGVVSLKL